MIVVLNRSFGEIDWIISSWSTLDLDSQQILFLCYRLDKSDVISYAPGLFLKRNVVVKNVSECFNGSGALNVIKRADTFLDRLSTFIFNKTKSHFIQKALDLCLVYMKRGIAKSLKIESLTSDGQDLYHENNDRSTILLELLRVGTKSVTFFPHHFGNTHPRGRLESKIFDSIGVQKCYVNYKEESDGENYLFLEKKLPKILEIEEGPIVLILTRQCSDYYGFNFKQGAEVVSSLLGQLSQMNNTVYIKHHPRDHNINEWRELTSNYKVNELYTSVLDFVVGKKIICFHLYTSLVEPISSLGVACYDISPYSNKLKNINYNAYMHIVNQVENNVTIRVEVSDLDLRDLLC